MGNTAAVASSSAVPENERITREPFPIFEGVMPPTHLTPDHLALHMLYNSNIREAIARRDVTIGNNEAFQYMIANTTNWPAQMAINPSDLDYTEQRFKADVEHELNTVQREYIDFLDQCLDEHMFERIKKWEEDKDQAYSEYREFEKQYGFVPNLENPDMYALQGPKAAAREISWKIKAIEDNVPSAYENLLKLLSGGAVVSRIEWWRNLAFEVAKFVAIDLGLALVTGGGSLIISASKLAINAVKVGAKIASAGSVSLATASLALAQATKTFFAGLASGVKAVIDDLFRLIDDIVDNFKRVFSDGIAGVRNKLARFGRACHSGKCV